MRVLLCSASPRRLDFLAALGISFEISAPRVDESRLAGEGVLEYVERVARAKLRTKPGFAGLSADTIVVLGDELLGKPRDRADAARMLRLLAGAEHRVITSVCVGDRQRTVETLVRFRKLSEAQLRWLVDSGDGDDKAGAYAV